jgi:dimethylargininase
MPLKAIIRDVSASINNCRMSFQSRQSIDVTRAMAQHKAYQNCLAELGLTIVPLAAEPDLPDAVFVEDTAVVLDEIAVIANMGATTRRPETGTIAEALAPYRSLKFLSEPGTLDGGDVVRVDRAIFVGLSRRTNRAGIAQLKGMLEPYDYKLQLVKVGGSLHLKSACSYVGKNTMLVQRSWIDTESLAGFTLLDVSEEEPAAANALLLNDVVVMPASFPKTCALLENRGFRVRMIDVSELQKAEAGVTCCSLIFAT